MAGSLLYARQEGPDDGVPFLVLHDRNGDLDSARELGLLLGQDTLRIGVRGPRLQTTGGSGLTHGYYWHIGPTDRPELSTLGDGLYQFELLFLQTVQRFAGRKVGLLGQGQGGVIAMLTALLWPEYVRAAIIMDAVLPTNLSDMPIESRPLNGLPMLLAGPSSNASGLQLAQRGARVTVTRDRPLAPLVADFIGVAV